MVFVMFGLLKCFSMCGSGGVCEGWLEVVGGWWWGG